MCHQVLDTSNTAINNLSKNNTSPVVCISEATQCVKDVTKMGIYTPAPFPNAHALKKYLISVDISDGEYLFKQGDETEGCYFIESGKVRTLFYDADLQTDTELEACSKGDVIGVVGLVDLMPRSISAKADGSVKARFLSKDVVNELLEKDIAAYKEFMHLTNMALSKKYRSMKNIEKAAALADASSPIVDRHLSRAVQAQQEILQWSEDRIDTLINDISMKINANAQKLAQKCVEESGMGVVDHKVIKIKLGSLDVANSLVNKPGNGELSLEGPDVEKITMPMGVIFGMIPITNPVETIVFKVLISIKSRNAIIVSSHRKGREVGDQTVEIIKEVLKAHGAPVDLVQTPDLPANRKVTNAFMKHPDMSFILATGGPNMVRSAYQSGTPAIGVGKGNAPVWICDDTNLDLAAQRVIASKSFDNGVVCGSENNLLVDKSAMADFVKAAEQHGAAFLNAEEALRLREAAFDRERLLANWNGQPAKHIALAANIQRDYEIKLLIVPVDVMDFESPLLREKLAPVLSCIEVTDTDQALLHAKAILNLEGAGHTAIIHSDNKERIQAFSRVVDVSRVLVNSSGTQGCIGAINGLNLSWTLGCGTMGGGSTSDNVSYTHLQNSKRVAYSQM